MPEPAPIDTSLFWVAIARLGEAQILLPAMLVAALWVGVRSHSSQAAWRWVAGTGIAAGLTTATKVAFMGWGVGYAPWNFVGISGHAMFAAAILPVLARVMVADVAPAWRQAAVAAGITVAALVAISRVVTGAHSVSESAIGFTVGSAASLWALRGMAVPRLQGTGWVVAGLVGWMLITPASAPPSRTHDWVTALSLALSGRDKPYTRWMMLRAYRQELRERGEPLPPPFGRRGPDAPARRGQPSASAATR